VRKELGMTGELTLTGRVLPIGGLKEKIIAARCAGLKVLIFPEWNRKDFDELPDYLKECWRCTSRRSTRMFTRWRSGKGEKSPEGSD